MRDTSARHDLATSRWHQRAASPRPPRPQSDPPAPRTPIERPRSVREAADELGLSVHTIRAWVASRRIAHVRLGRAVRIPASAIRRLVEDNTVAAIEGR